MDPVPRRGVLATAAALSTAGLAGCSALLEDGGADDGTGADSDGPGGPALRYELDFTLETGEVDLTDLDTSSLHEMDEIREEDYIEASIDVYEVLDGERTELETDEYSLELQVNDQGVEYGVVETEENEDVDEIYRVACTELEPGENTVTVDAKPDGPTLRDSATANKIVPEHDAIRIGEDQNPEDAPTPYQFAVYQPDRSDWPGARQDYRNERLTADRVNWKNWVDENIQNIDTSGDVPDTIWRIADNWYDRVRDNDMTPSLRAEQLGMTIEYAFQEHLDHELYGGGIGNFDLQKNGTHHTAQAWNPETENIWHIDTNGGITIAMEDAGVPDSDRYISGLNFEECIEAGYRGFAEDTATGFTHVDGVGPSGTREQVTHTDEALDDVTTLMRENGDFSTVNQVSRDAILLGEQYDDRHFKLDAASETGPQTADLKVEVIPE